MDKLKNMTLKRAFFLIVSVTAVIVIFLSVVTVRKCSKIHDQITFSHAFVTNGALFEIENGRYVMDAELDQITDESVKYTDRELFICRMMELFIVLLPVTFSVTGIGCAGMLFYHIKLKEPLTALRQGISHIADNDLDFAINYHKQDELGELCSAFE